MIANFGFNVFEFWLEPRLFCREAIDSPLGKEFARQLNAVIEHANARRLQVEMIVAKDHLETIRVAPEFAAQAAAVVQALRDAAERTDASW